LNGVAAQTLKSGRRPTEEKLKRKKRKVRGLRKIKRRSKTKQKKKKKNSEEFFKKVFVEVPILLNNW
jgi:hypothetical protein